jgi:solute carrier family 35, member E3
LLSALHFLVGYLFLQFVSQPKFGNSRLFIRKELPLSIILPVAIMGMGSIVVMNYSLRFNSVGSYQLLKVAVLPATVGLSALQGTKLTSVDIGCAILITFGMCIGTVTDLSLTLLGTAIGIVAVLATAQYQIYQGRVQKENDVSSTQALHCISLPQALLTMLCSLAFETTWARFLPNTSTAAGALQSKGAVRGAGGSVDTPINVSLPEDIWSHPYDWTEVGLILLTCAAAVVLNYSGIALIGRISSIGFQMVNQTKTLLILSVGLLVFAESTDFARLLSLGVGLSCVLTGIIWYTKSKQGPPRK